MAELLTEDADDGPRNSRISGTMEFSMAYVRWLIDRSAKVDEAKTILAEFAEMAVDRTRLRQELAQVTRMRDYADATVKTLRDERAELQGRIDELEEQLRSEKQ